MEMEILPQKSQILNNTKIQHLLSNETIDYTENILTPSTNWCINGNKNSSKKENEFICKNCSYNTFIKKDYSKHLLTMKHHKNLNKKENSQKDNSFVCENCGKTYKSTSGLWKHKQSCKICVNNNNKQEINSTLILKILEENNELRKMMKKQQEEENNELRKMMKKQQDQISELIPQVGNNNNNTQFNLNLFLNEQCKDALNWNEFIQSIEVGMSDMEHAVESDITKGVVKVICNGINKLGVYKRPIHCLDMKRKKLCLKNKDVWEKDSGKIKETLEMGNRKIQQKHMIFIKEWEERHPGWEKDEKMRDVYNNIVQQLMKDVEEDKCINEISKHTTIPKEITDETALN